MKTRIIVAAIAIPVLFVILFFLPSFALAIVVAAICALAAYEFMKAVCPECETNIKIYTICPAVLIPFAMLVPMGHELTRGVMVLFMLTLFGEAIWEYNKEKTIKFEYIAYAVYIGIIYPVMMSSLVTLKCMENGRLYVLLPVVVTFCCDSGAYFAGMFMGKRRVLRVSPNKSIEGFIGGIITGFVTMMVYGIIVAVATDLKVNFIAMALYGLLGSVAVELGDLAYSFIKRQKDIKDYGNLIPGHGGMLDRFDSMSFAAPLICALSSVLPVFTVFTA